MALTEKQKHKNLNNDRVRIEISNLIRSKGPEITPALEQEVKKIFSLYHPPLISFDFAIKFILRNKSCYFILENFISEIFKSAGYKAVKIVKILDPESNKEHLDAKRSIVDILVEAEDKDLYMIEIDKYHNRLLFHKSLFNTSRLVVDSIKSGEKYGKIKKIFHISIAYFPLGDSVLYHGSTQIRSLSTKELLVYNLKDEENKEYNAASIFPTYFFVSIPSFNDIINTEFDEWLYVRILCDDLRSSSQLKRKQMSSGAALHSSENI